MFYPHGFLPFWGLFGLQLILIYCNQLVGAAADQKNHENKRPFEGNLNDFANIAEKLSSGLNLNLNKLKTVAKAAQFLSGDIDFEDEETEECKFVCKNGMTPMKRAGYIPKDNGCGAYGLKVDLSKLPGMERCCSKHDRCYGQCGTGKETCDDQFSKCLQMVCIQLQGTMDLNLEESEGCMMTVQLMYMTVMELGCQAYLDAQEEACVCKIDNRTMHKTMNLKNEL